MGMMGVSIIGGGASGMVAAICRARHGEKVCLFEKNDRLGKKLLATGNGRCNYTNILCERSAYFCREGDEKDRFLKTVFEIAGAKRVISFFYELGIYPREEAQGRLYPRSEQASSLLDALRMEIEYLRIPVEYNSEINQIIPFKEGGFEVVLKNGNKFRSEEVVIACGGMAGPQFGCQGSGYSIAKKFSHAIISPRPALCQLLSNEWYFKQLKGVRVKGSVSLEGFQEEGEIQFTEQGISGICVFNISHFAGELLDRSKIITVQLDLFPDIETAEFMKIMRHRLDCLQHRTIEEFLNGLVNIKLMPPILKLSGIKNTRRLCKEMCQDELESICKQLKNWIIEVNGMKSWSEAQVTAGGVSVSHLHAKTMESKHTKGLYFIGEVVDIDGKCGGYNLMWAFASAILAGDAHQNTVFPRE